ncbi:MAG TPA: DinB family protein [Parafilimonas sp.]|nr:DinB family protein [Parafilimonas sp.]
MTQEKINTTTLFNSLDTASNELISLVQNEDEKTLNTIPFKNSWTAAQVLIHITKSNKAIAQGLQMQGILAERDPEEKAEQLKKMFLDFTVKFKSPAFIIPEKGHHNKAETINTLKASIESLQVKRNETDLSEIISLPAFGEITKLELLHFVLYHTQRHINQLKNILQLC